MYTHIANENVTLSLHKKCFMIKLNLYNDDDVRHKINFNFPLIKSNINT